MLGRVGEVRGLRVLLLMLLLQMLTPCLPGRVLCRR